MPDIDPNSHPAFDLVIRGGTIVDGTGQDRFTGDVAIKDGLIAASRHDIRRRGARRSMPPARS